MMDQKKVRVAVTAPRGAMDSLILQEAYKNEEIEVVGAVGTPGRDYIGKDAGLVCGLGQEIGAPVVDDIGKIIDDCDIVIDFSRVELSMQILDACLRHGKGLICGTTGFSEEQTEVLLAAGDKIRDICVHPPTPGAAFAGGNVTVVEMGAIPRDDKVSAAEWLGYTASDAKAMMEEAGLRVISDVRKE